MESVIDELKMILEEEENLLNQLTIKQSDLRNAVTEKNWEFLISSIAVINQISDEFQKLDIKRDEIQKNLSINELKPLMESIRLVRSKLLKCKVENRVLGDYVAIAKSFVQDVVEKAVPQNRNKNYSRDGRIIQPQPKSVVLNQLY